MIQSNQQFPPVAIDMVADPVCPWCYIGFRALDWVAMALSFETPLAIRYRPYRLDPTTPPEGRDRAATLAAKFPDPGHRAAVNDALKTAMADVGLSFDPGLPPRLPDPTDAQRLVLWSHADGLQRETMAALFDAYWQHGEDISQRDVLRQVAITAGLDGDDVAERLETNEDRTAIAEEAAAFRQGGVDGVPTFIVGEQAGFAGALPKAKMLEAFRTLIADLDEADPA